VRRRLRPRVWRVLPWCSTYGVDPLPYAAARGHGLAFLAPGVRLVELLKRAGLDIGIVPTPV
ncbi:hypothetical protein, partial [Thermogladius sp.]|uniref:hypothetical protein n=1 Tax=Thermogladius sp. TaxID=2023064 RepID=UPI003D1202CC